MGVASTEITGERDMGHKQPGRARQLAYNVRASKGK